jgi:hypothetical protein
LALFGHNAMPDLSPLCSSKADITPRPALIGLVSTFAPTPMRVLDAKHSKRVRSNLDQLG